MTRPCTCHPQDNPPSPCAEKYALSECRIAALKAENERLRKALKGVAGYSTMRFRDWDAEFPELSKAIAKKPMSQYASIFARHASAALKAQPSDAKPIDQTDDREEAYVKYGLREEDLP